MIYYSSLYFGMALSHGSTRHGGYHQALVGLGSVLGPGFAALAAVVWPAAVNASITAVGAMILLSIGAVAGITLKYSIKFEAGERGRAREKGRESLISTPHE